ncbi:endolysin [Vibrio phage 11895-B1]|uniref:endolysin n=1 Tax=Vibrio phage 11895-B1 TaxID=754075 RepID=UPI0002C10571|nr:endolysin [Vibrio phage 11895-B1]AGH32070.1 hypothetical protein VPHG_00003 [Vibrio phage 11895-B1]
MNRHGWLGWVVFWGIITILVSSESEASTITPPPYSDMKGKPLSSIECLAVNAYMEGRSESDMANIMIMATVINRVNDPRHKANTICDVIFYPHAYSWTNDGKSDKIVNIEQYRRLYRLAEKFLLNKKMFISISEGVDHYHKVGHKTNWNYRVLDYVGRFDDHVFYRWKK